LSRPIRTRPLLNASGNCACKEGDLQPLPRTLLRVSRECVTCV
jgi:hypothetical protein